MGIKDIFKRSEEITLSVDDVLLKALLDSEIITREKAMTIPFVSGAVNFLTDTIASIPIKLYKEKDDCVEEVKMDSRVFLLNNETNDTLDSFQMKKAIVEDYLLGKGGYAYIKKSKNDFIGLNYVRDDKITIFKNNDAINKSYYFSVDGKKYKDFEFIKLLRNTKDGASGIGVVEELSKAFETAFQTQLYQLSLVKSGGNKKGFIKSNTKLTQETIDSLKKAWSNMYKNNSENVVVLNNGLEFQESSNSSVEMQLDQNKTTLQREINYIFHIENDYELTFKKAIMPIIKAFETALNRDFLLEKEKKEYFWAFDTKEILRASTKDRFEGYLKAKQCGMMTINEMRYEENMNAIDGMDIIPMSLADVIYNIKSKEYYTPNTNQVKNENTSEEMTENVEKKEVKEDEITN